MHYSLYFPGTNAPLADHFARCGLADLSRGSSPEIVPLERGPDGKPGLLAVWRRGDAKTDPPLSLLPTQSASNG